MNQIESKSGMGNSKALIAFEDICPEYRILPIQCIICRIQCIEIAIECIVNKCGEFL